MSNGIDYPVGYDKVWSEPQNIEALESLHGIRRRLHPPGMGEPVIITLQPGDGTRYRFMLVPKPYTFVVSDDGRDVGREHGDPDILYVTVLDGLGHGTARVHRESGIDGIRYRISDQMSIGNPCTAEALAQTILAVWACNEHEAN